MDIIETIRRKQALIVLSPDRPPPKHAPEMLYIGCVDARLDPIADIGISKGKALIFRNIAALVLKDERGGGAFDMDAVRQSILQGGEIPPNVSMGAVLEFFLNHIPLEQGKAKHIVIAPHTDCGGLKACQHNRFGERDHYLPLYLESLSGVRARVMDEAKRHGWDDAQVLKALEKQSLRQSMDNLLSHQVVEHAIDQGTLKRENVHGWVIDTTTQHILEMDPQTREFAPMSAKCGTHVAVAPLSGRHR